MVWLGFVKTNVNYVQNQFNQFNKAQNANSQEKTHCTSFEKVLINLIIRLSQRKKIFFIYLC